MGGSRSHSVDTWTRPAPAFWLALGANWLVATVVWIAGASWYGSEDFFDYHLAVWTLPVLIVLAMSAGAGVVYLFTPGRRRVGAAVLTGTLIAGLADLVWMFAALLDRVE